MPCYEERDHREVRTVYTKGVDPEPYNNKISNLKEKVVQLEEKVVQLEDKVSRLEAGLCAIITELEKKGIANEVISQASKSGLINLMDFWEKHSKEDEARLAKKFHSFSEHEQEVIRKFIKDGKF